jgi:hypothetical protein
MHARKVGFSSRKSHQARPFNGHDYSDSALRGAQNQDGNKEEGWDKKTELEGAVFELRDELTPARHRHWSLVDFV